MEVRYSNHPLIVRSNASLGSSCEVEQDCGVSFVNYLYLVSLIVCQNFRAICATIIQTGPQLAAAAATRLVCFFPCGFERSYFLLEKLILAVVPSFCNLNFFKINETFCRIATAQLQSSA